MRILFLFVVTGLWAVAAPEVHAHGAASERIRELTTAIARTPTDVTAIIERADLYRETGDWNHALADYEHALALDSARIDVHLGRARVLIEKGAWSEALRAIDAFVREEPGDARAWRLLSLSLSGLGRVPEAVDALTLAIDLSDPPSPDDYVRRAQLQASLGRSQIDAAVAGLDEGLDRLGAAVALQHLAIDLERQRGSYDDALTRLDRMQRQYVRAETLLVLRGDILTDAGRPTEASAAYREALLAIEARRSQGRATPATDRLYVELLSKLHGEAK